MITDTRSLWPVRNVKPSNHWGAIAGALQFGASTPADGLSRPLLLCIRGVAPLEPSSHHVVSRPEYDDTFVLLEDMRPPFVCAACTHPYQRTSTKSPDVTRDGRGDVGCIRAAERVPDSPRWVGGRYVLRRALLRPFPIFIVETVDGRTKIPCVRDTNQDGRHDQAEDADSRRRGDTASGVLLHVGWDAPAESEHRSSIACLTCSLPDLQRLAKHASIDVLLVNAWDAVELAPSPAPLTGVA